MRHSRTLISRRKLIHAAVIAACLTPAALLFFDAWATWGGEPAVPPPLGANPIEYITRFSGEWTLRFLVLTLAVTPLRRLGWKQLAPYRRTLGLTTFFYACIHLATYVGLDLGFDLSSVAEDIRKRPYITVGFTGFMILLVLAVTSTRRAMKRLGRHWTQLHRLVYVAALCGVVHFIWLTKADFREPTIYAVIVVVLLLTRLVPARKRNIPAHLAPGS